MKKIALLFTLTITGLLSNLALAQNVGVDVASPVEKLDVLGAIRIGNTSNTNAGAIRWNSPNFQGYDGTQWVNFGGGTLTGSGTATRVAFWSGTSVLSSNANLYWDNTYSRLGVGLSNPIGVISAGSTFGNKVLAYDDGTNASGLGIQAGVLQMFTSNNTSNIVFGYGSSGSFTENIRFTGTGNVGIGTTAPGARLEVAGQIKITGGSPGANKVLTSDAAGLASWVDPNTLVTNGWKLTGNASTIDGTNFIGTTDNIPLTIKVNGQKAGRIDHLLFNTFWGYKAGATTTGGYNTVVGFEAMPISTSAQGNIVNGYHAMYLNTSGSFNIVSGFEALYSNTTGFQNMAIGYQAMYSNINGQDNMAMGWQALYSNVSGTQNTAIGNQALYSHISGSFNAAFGYQALYNNKSGNFGVAVGMRSQYYAYNTASGWDNANTSIGYQSLMGSTTPAANSGNFNTAIGRNTLFTNSSGSNNTAVGYTAGDINTTGSSNTFLGYNADAAANNLSNATAIGANASVNTSNKVQIGDGSVTAVQLGTGTNVTLETGLVKITGGTPALNQVLTSDASGLATWEPAQGDNLGDHTATTNIQLNDNWLSNDGGSEGIRVDNTGNVGVGLAPSSSAYLDITGTNGGTTSLQLRSGNTGVGTSSNQVVFGFSGAETYRHAIKTRHNSGSANSNSIDFYVWKYGTDAAGDVGTQQVMTIDGGSGGSVGIGTTAPSATLDIVGTMQYADGNQGTGKVLTSDANGNASWGSPIPAGMIIPTAASSVPSGYLECNGAAVSRTTYASLFASIGTIYGVGDGSTTFNLPDYRGYFLRGWDHGSGADPDAGSRTDRGDGTTGNNIGTKQIDGFKSHTHSYVTPQNYDDVIGGTGTSARIQTTGTTGATGGNETRPKNINVMYCIKY